MKITPQNLPRQAAFTMIEILLAIAIFAIVMAAIYSSWSAIMRASRAGLVAAADVQRARVAVRALEESLSSAVMYTDNPKYYGFFADTGGSYGFLSFVARLPESFPGSGLFPGQELRRVTFSVSGSGQLLLAQSPVLEATELVAKPYTIVLAPKTSLFAMEFYDGRRNEWVPEWIYTNALPKMARVAVAFGEKKSYSKRTDDVTLKVIPMNAVAISRAGAILGTVPPGQPLPSGAQLPGRVNMPGGAGPAQNDFSFMPPPPGEGWRPPIPNDFWQNRGAVDHNPVFPMPF